MVPHWWVVQEMLHSKHFICNMTIGAAFLFSCQYCLRKLQTQGRGNWRSCWRRCPLVRRISPGRGKTDWKRYNHHDWSSITLESGAHEVSIVLHILVQAKDCLLKTIGEDAKRLVSDVITQCSKWLLLACAIYRWRKPLSKPGSSLTFRFQRRRAGFLWYDIISN